MSESKAVLGPSTSSSVKDLMSLRVNPKSFMMGVSYGTSEQANHVRLNPTQETEIIKEFKQEFKKAELKQQFKYQDLPIERGGIVEKSNVLIVDFLSHSVGSGLALTQS